MQIYSTKSCSLSKTKTKDTAIDLINDKILESTKYYHSINFDMDPNTRDITITPKNVSIDELATIIKKAAFKAQLELSYIIFAQEMQKMMNEFIESGGKMIDLLNRLEGVRSKDLVTRTGLNYKFGRLCPDTNALNTKYIIISPSAFGLIYFMLKYKTVRNEVLKLIGANDEEYKIGNILINIISDFYFDDSMSGGVQRIVSPFNNRKSKSSSYCADTASVNNKTLGPDNCRKIMSEIFKKFPNVLSTFTTKEMLFLSEFSIATEKITNASLSDLNNDIFVNKISSFKYLLFIYLDKIFEIIEKDGGEKNAEFCNFVVSILYS